MDMTALEALAEEPLDWRAKGFPLDGRYPTIRAVREAGPSLFDGGFATPVGVLAEEALEHNLATMADYCAAAGVRLAPHGKTSMAPQLFDRQRRHGAWAITAATPWQVRVLRKFGVPRVLLANELVDRHAIAWVARELATDPGFEFVCYVDDVRGVGELEQSLAEAGGARPVDVVVEVGYPGGRTGCREDEHVDAVAAAAAAAPHLRLVGVAGYEGTIGHSATPEVVARVRAFLGRVRAAGERLARDRVFDTTPADPEDPARAPSVVLTAGGSMFFDEVVEVLTGPLPGGVHAEVVIRSGGYVTHDDGLYVDVSPFARRPGLHGPLKPAFTVWTRVLSRPEPTLAFVDAGKRDLPHDAGMPVPRRLRHGGVEGAVDGMRLDDMNDQHGYLALPAESPLVPGDWVGFGISHPCTAFDKWPFLAVVDAGDRVVDVVRTYF